MVSKETQLRRGDRSNQRTHRFCARRCLSGLTSGGNLDHECPNVKDHGTTVHHVDKDMFLTMMRDQHPPAGVISGEFCDALPDRLPNSWPICTSRHSSMLEGVVRLPGKLYECNFYAPTAHCKQCNVKETDPGRTPARLHDLHPAGHDGSLIKLYFSDSVEVFNGQFSLDALEWVSSAAKGTYQAFGIYRRPCDGSDNGVQFGRLGNLV
jgi:hypothetical protein